MSATEKLFGMLTGAKDLPGNPFFQNVNPNQAVDYDHVKASFKYIRVQNTLADKKNSFLGMWLKPLFDIVKAASDVQDGYRAAFIKDNKGLNYNEGITHGPMNEAIREFQEALIFKGPNFRQQIDYECGLFGMDPQIFKNCFLGFVVAGGVNFSPNFMNNAALMIGATGPIYPDSGSSRDFTNKMMQITGRPQKRNFGRPHGHHGRKGRGRRRRRY
jgi:hypothetical protein